MLPPIQPKPATVYDRSPGNLALRCCRNDSWKADLRFVQTVPDGSRKDPIDLRGLSWMAVVKEVNSEFVKLLLDVDDTNASIGELTVSAEANDLSSLRLGTYRWFLQCVDAAGKNYTYLSGAFEITEQ